MDQRPDQQPEYDQPQPYEPTRSRSGGQGQQYPPQDSYTGQPYATGQPYQQQPYYGQPYQPQAAPPKKKRGSRIAGFGCLGVAALIAIIIVAAAASGSKTADTATTGSGTTATQGAATGDGQAPAVAPATSQAAPPAPAKTVVLTKSGQGIEQTRLFTVGDDWSLTYSFDCSNFGMQGNFQVFEDYPGGDVLVNALAKKGGDVTYQTGDAGTHSLKINSECAWKVTVTDGDTGQ